MEDYRSIQIGKNKIYFYITEEGKPTIYLHGRGLKPELHTRLFQGLNEHGMAVVSPYFYGLRKQPHSLEQEADLLNEFCHRIGLGETDMIGHSSGALTMFYYALNSSEPQKLVAINPVLKRKHSGLKTSVIAVKGIARSNLGLGSYITGSFRNPSAIIATIKASNQILNFNYDDLTGKINQPTLILHCTEDELYNLDEETEEAIKNKFRDVRFKEVKGTHIEPITNPQILLEEIIQFLASNRRNI